MMDLSPETVSSVFAAAQAGAEEAAQALKRTFDVEVLATVGEPGTMQSAAAVDFGQAGLVIVLKMQEKAALIAIASETLLPQWCIVPDPTGQSKLATLAQELGMNLYPDSWIPDDFATHWVPNVSEALARGGVAADGTLIPITLAQAGQPLGSMALVWPAVKPDEIVQTRPPAPPSTTAAPNRPASTAERRVINAKDLPPYTRTLLRITVPVVVTLARKRQALSRILELSPGSIIQFDKPCEDMLELMIGNRPVAVGEAVKVGDKFGLRITSIAAPEERFRKASPRELRL
jgi:flagellar motor switch/type III secretory pathway protein FliN